MAGNGRCSWDDGQVRRLVAQAVDNGEADCDESPTSAAQDHRPADRFLADVVDAGRAAFVWLDVVVFVRHVTRHGGSPRGTPTHHEPAFNWVVP